MSYCIGVDGGGTKTECILVDAAGTVVATHVAPGCNPSQVGAEMAREILAGAMRALLHAAGGAAGDGSISHTLLCMAGAPAFWRELAASLAGFGRVNSTDDAAPILELATAGAAGLALHAGTGSFVTARGLDGAVHYAGGLGWKIGDPGSGFDLGRRALAVALLELQSVPDPTARTELVRALQAHTGLGDYASHSRFFYHDPAANAVIAGFAPRVLELAGDGDGPARAVVTESVTALAEVAESVILRLFAGSTAPVPCGISGRILNSPPAAGPLRRLAAAERHWPVRLESVTSPASEGVRRLLLARR